MGVPGRVDDNSKYEECAYPSLPSPDIETGLHEAGVETSLKQHGMYSSVCA